MISLIILFYNVILHQICWVFTYKYVWIGAKVSRDQIVWVDHFYQRNIRILQLIKQSIDVAVVLAMKRIDKGSLVSTFNYLWQILQKQSSIITQYIKHNSNSHLIHITNFGITKKNNLVKIKSVN